MKITSKQRAYLRGMANSLEALYQMGKNGVTDEFIEQIEEALNAKELIKITVLKNAFFSSKEAMEIVCESLKCAPVSAIGQKIVVYRKSKDPKKVKIELPK